MVWDVFPVRNSKNWQNLNRKLPENVFLEKLSFGACKLVHVISYFSKKNFDRFTKKYDILLVYFYSPPSTPGEEKNWELTESMLELAAQITEREGVAFGVVDLCKFWPFFDALDDNIYRGCHIRLYHLVIC